MKYVIVDIDGTIADHTHRLHYLEQSPKDWDSFYNECERDKPIDSMIELVRHLGEHYKVIYLSGRRASCGVDTYTWLLCQDLPNAVIVLREDGNKEKDIDLKPKMLDAFLEATKHTKEDVAFILEDRTSMVKKWRELGYTCLQVADGNY